MHFTFLHYIKKKLERRILKQNLISFKQKQLFYLDFWSEIWARHVFDSVNLDSNQQKQLKTEWMSWKHGSNVNAYLFITIKRIWG